MSIYTSKIMGITCFYYSTKESNCIKTPFVWLSKINKKMYYLCGFSTVLDKFVPTKYRNGIEDEKIAFSYLKELSVMIEKFDNKKMRQYCLYNPFGKSYSHDFLYDFNLLDRLIKKSKPTSKE